MIAQDLVDYIKQMLQLGTQEGVITNTLMQQGWGEADIAGGFQQARVGNKQANVVPNPNQSVNQNPGSGSIKYAGFWVRLAAYIVDGIIVSIANSAIIFLAGTLFKGSPAVMLVIVLLEIIIAWSYFIFMTYKYQATFGKKLVGICVLDENGNIPSLGKIILRETIGKIVSGVILNLGFIMAGFTERKQGLHDMMASTVVTYRDPNKKISKWVYVVLIVPVVIILAVLVGVTLVFTKQKQFKNIQQMQNNQPAVTAPAVSSVPTSSSNPIYQQDPNATTLTPVSYSVITVRMDGAVCISRGGEATSPFIDCKSGVSLGLVNGFTVNGKQGYCCKK